MTTSTTPRFMSHAPRELAFGTSGLRGLVTDMTDLEVYINTRGFLRFLVDAGDAAPGDRVAVGEDLRDRDPGSGLSSSPRIARAVAQAVRDEGLTVTYCGTVPTPTLALYAHHRDPDRGKRPGPAVMVTGSHIPADRNGIKYFKSHGEVLKSDEAAILAAVRQVREEEYAREASATRFDEQGGFREAVSMPPVDPGAAELYRERYFGLAGTAPPLRGMRLVLYEHSAVGRDLVREIFQRLGAEVVCQGRSDHFVSVDTEDVSREDEARYGELVRQHQADALLSTDGDSDRPLVVDETGRFWRGDVVGIVTAELLGARFAAVPVSTTDALDLHVARTRAHGPPLEVRKTRIGSPYVIAAMDEARARGVEGIVSWEANGGFLLGSPFVVDGWRLEPLPTRDAVLPMVAVLLTAARRRVPVSRVFQALPSRATRAGLLDNFPRAVSERLLARVRPADATIMEVQYTEEGVTVTRSSGEAVSWSRVDDEAAELMACRETLERYFSPAHGFDGVARVSYLDGARVFFAGGDVAHLRPSGNAPQLRLYAVAATQERADAIVEGAIREPDGLLREMEADLS